MDVTFLTYPHHNHNLRGDAQSSNMSFRKRSIPLANTANVASTATAGSIAPTTAAKQPLALGVRTSPTFSVSTTSTGLSSLDSLLRLGAGLALGSSLVIEEDGTTDYAGAILRCFASEGVLQGHKVFIAAAEHWGAGLPGIAVEKVKREKISEKEKTAADERMKIAWRYEKMGLHGDAPTRSGALDHLVPLLVAISCFQENNAKISPTHLLVWIVSDG